VCDPYNLVFGFPYGLSPLPGDVTADAVTVSRAHVDHNNTAAFPGATVIEAPGEYQIGGMVKITGYQGFQGEEGLPDEAAPNVIFVIEVAGVKIVHLGDSAVVTDPSIVAAISDADFALLNIDPYVIPWDEGMPFMDRIAARTIIPSHYSHAAAPPTGGLSQYVSLQSFLRRLRPDVIVVDGGETEIDVPPDTPRQFVIMTPLFLASD